MDEYDITTDGWADRVPLDYLDPSYPLFSLPTSPPSIQEDSGRKRRRSVVDNNNIGPQLFPQSLTSPHEQPNRKRRRLVVENNDSPQLFPQSLPFPHEQPNRKRRRSVFDNDHHSPQLFPQSQPFPHEQTNREHPQRIFEPQGPALDEQKDESETHFWDWSKTSRATSAVPTNNFQTDLWASTSSFNNSAAPKTLPPPPEATQNERASQPHNLVGNRLEADTKAAEGVKWCCTICDKGPFKGKPGWQKHEEKQHFPRYTAYCQPNIGMDGLILYCSVCNVKNPQCRHVAVHRSAVCATKSLAERRYLTKESFIGHLKTEHSLPSDCPEVEEWERKPPRHVWACGFCPDQHFNGVEDRWRHIARHYNANFTIADWKHCAVTLKLLGQSFVVAEWFEHCRMMFAPETHPGKWPPIVWSDDEAKALQERLTAGQEEDGKKLAEDAFNASQIGKQMQWRRQQQQQQQQQQQEQQQHPQHREQHQHHQHKQQHQHQPQQQHREQHQHHQQRQQHQHQPQQQQRQQRQQRQQQERDMLALGIPQ